MIFRPYYYYDLGCAAYVFGWQKMRVNRGQEFVIGGPNSHAASALSTASMRPPT